MMTVKQRTSSVASFTLTKRGKLQRQAGFGNDRDCRLLGLINMENRVSLQCLRQGRNL